MYVQVLEDEVCFRRGHFRTPTKVADNELPKFRRILSNHMHEEILATGDKENVSHLRHLCQPSGERMHYVTGIYLQADGNDRLKRVSHRLGVDVGVEASDDAALHQ